MTQENILQTVHKNELLKILSPSSLEKIFAGQETADYNLGDIIAKSGENTDFISVILEGRVRLVDDSTGDKPVTLLLLKNGDAIGLDCLLNSRHYAYGVRAGGKVKLLNIPVENFEEIFESEKEFKKKLAGETEKLSEYIFLRKQNIFKNLKPKDPFEYLPLLNKIILEKGQKIFSESGKQSKAYLVASGRLKLFKESADNKLLLFVLAGDIIGERALLNDEPYFESAVAEEETIVYEINSSVYKTISSKDASIKEYIQSILVNRKRQYEILLGSGNEPELTELSQEIRYLNYSGGIKNGNIIYCTAENPLLNGVACLEIIKSYYNIKDNPQKFIEEQLLLKKQDDLNSLSRKLEAYGLLTRLMYISKKQLTGFTLPGIIKWNNENCVALISVNSKEVLLASPEYGILKVKSEEFYDKWDNKILSVNYVPHFGGAKKELKKIFARFFPLLKPYRNLLLGVILISIFLQVINLVLPIFSKVIIDKVLVFRDKSLLYIMLIGMLIVTVFQLFGSALRTYLVAHAMRRVSATMQIRFLKHIFQLPQKIFGKWRVGDFTTRFQENDKVLQLVSQNGFKMIVDSSTILIYIIIIFSANATLAGYSLLFIAAYAALIIFSSPVLRRYDIKIFDKLKDTESFVIESVGNIATVKSMAAEKIFFRDGMKKFIDSKTIEFKGAMFSQNISLISTIINEGSVILVLGMGAQMVLQGKMTTGELIYFNMTLGLMLAPMKSLIGMWDEIQQLRVSFERLNDVLSEETEPVDNMIITEPLKGDIKIEELYFKYEGAEKYNLENINLDIVAGQKIAFVGRSGSGKTTLVNLLMKLYEPVKGKIYYDSRDISEVDNSSLRNQIGYVEQSPFLFNGTVKENITKANEKISYKEMVEIAKLAGVDEFVSEMPMKYDTQIGEKGITLSGGQRQRLVIARALMNNPRILILDEATSALDTETERIIQRNLDAIMKGRTTIIVAHRLSTIKNADKIVVLDNGEIVEIGTHDELLEQGGLYYYLTQKSGDNNG